MNTLSLIPTSGGNCPRTGLPDQHVYCVVFDRNTLEILDAAGTHNAAQEIANSIYVNKKIDAIADELRFYNNDEPLSIIGMTLDQFEHFVENNPNHPLIAGK
jgi:hypothetical protein